jgi:hypothetical protein
MRPDEIVIEIGGPTLDRYVVKSYPLPVSPPDFYEVPLYSVSIFKAKDHLKTESYTQRQDFKAVRFGVYKNDGSIKKYKDIGFFVVGKSHDHWYRLNTYLHYRLHSVQTNPDNGAWVIEGTHYIHSGPSGFNDTGYGTAGCVEIFGKNEFNRFSDVLTRYANASSRDKVPTSAPVWIHVKHANKPPIVPK